MHAYNSEQSYFRQGTQYLGIIKSFSSHGCGDLCVTNSTSGDVKLRVVHNCLSPIYICEQCTAS